MKSFTLFPVLFFLVACSSGTPEYDATGTFEATDVVVSAEASGKILGLDVEEGTVLKAGQEAGIIDTVQLYLKKLQLEAGVKSVNKQGNEMSVAAEVYEPATGIVMKVETDQPPSVRPVQTKIYMPHPGTYRPRQPSILLISCAFSSFSIDQIRHFVFISNNHCFYFVSMLHILMNKTKER